MALSEAKYCQACGAEIVIAKSASTGKPVPLAPLSVHPLDREKPDLVYNRQAGHVAHFCKGKAVS